MLYKRKYRKGAQIKTVGEAADLISGGHCVYIGDKIQNPGWLLNITLFTLRCYVRGVHGVFRAEENIPEAPKEIEYRG